jgi:hypothetical protein
MADQRKKQGVSDRLTGRLDRSELRHQTMSSGQGVFRGELATRALEAVGARAMTLDRSVLVGDSFDPSRAEDQALYAHERYHAEHGDGDGGGAGNNFRDAEEIAARAVERLSLHNATAGGHEIGGSSHAGGSGAQSDRHQAVTEQAEKAMAPSETAETTAPEPSTGYKALRSQGLSHEQVVQQLAQEVLRSIQEDFDASGNRGGHLKGTF